MLSLFLALYCCLLTRLFPTVLCQSATVAPFPYTSPSSCGEREFFSPGNLSCVSCEANSSRSSDGRRTKGRRKRPFRFSDALFCDRIEAGGDAFSSMVGIRDLVIYRLPWQFHCSGFCFRVGFSCVCDPGFIFDLATSTCQACPENQVCLLVVDTTNSTVCRIVRSL